MTRLFDPVPPGLVLVKLSAASMRQRFAGCEPDYIRDVCQGRCCRAPSHPDRIVVTVHPDELLDVLGSPNAVRVHLGRVVADDRGRCPNQGETGLCGVHGTPAKPHGCTISPWTLNTNNTLIISNRYRRLICFDDGPRRPAYDAFRDSLAAAIGEDNTARAVEHITAGGHDLYVTVEQWRVDRLHHKQQTSLTATRGHQQ